MRAPFEHETDPELRRRCAKRRCPQPARTGGSRRGALCTTHHAAAMRQWRARRRAAGKPTAGATPTAPSSAVDALRERKQLSRARRRGQVLPQPCAACRRREGVVATHPDPAEPQTIVWACRRCRLLLVRGAVERKRDRQRDVEDERKRVAFAELCAEVAALVEALPPNVAATLHAAASRGGRLGQLRPGQPAYTQQLARAYLAWRNALPRGSDDSTRSS